MSDAEKQTTFLFDQINETKATWINDAQNKKKPEVVSPRSMTPDGKLSMVAAKDWTSGFFPGELWYLYELTGKDQWKAQAEAFTAKIENEKLNGGTHDMGFKIYCSFGNGYRLINNEAYRAVIVQSAITLAKRFNPKTGCIRSWDHSRDKWDNPVIIDNMMNLELLFEASKMTKSQSFYKIAVSHANTTMKNHFRPDFSSWHVVDYDSITGKILKKTTHQGFSNESAWARGQAWGLYGFTMCYRETGQVSFLNQAEKIADFILHHPSLPADKIPFWDFDAAPASPSQPRDASAAAITASALFELAQFLPSKKDFYLQSAGTILNKLTDKYMSKPGENKGFLLGHSTGSFPQNVEVDVPIIYADYYYLEALQRKSNLKNK